MQEPILHICQTQKHYALHSEHIKDALSVSLSRSLSLSASPHPPPLTCLITIFITSPCFWMGLCNENTQKSLRLRWGERARESVPERESVRVWKAKWTANDLARLKLMHKICPIDKVRDRVCSSQPANRLQNPLIVPLTPLSPHGEGAQYVL